MIPRTFHGSAVESDHITPPKALRIRKDFIWVTVRVLFNPLFVSQSTLTPGTSTSTSEAFEEYTSHKKATSTHSQSICHT
jgi:hypothetical protein